MYLQTVSEQHYRPGFLSDSQTTTGRKIAPEWKQRRAAVNVEQQPEGKAPSAQTPAQRVRLFM